MSDSKIAAAVHLWVGRLSPAIDSALLPELVRIIAEYCVMRAIWSARLSAPSITITDPDGDGPLMAADES